MISKNVTEAKAQLSALLESVEQGEEVLITRGSRPVALLIPFVVQKKERQAGKLKGKIKIAADFDSLPAEIEEAFGIK